MSRHSGLQCEQPFRIKESLAKAVRMGGRRFRMEMEFMLTTGFWLLTTRKTEGFAIGPGHPLSSIKRPFSFRQAENGKSLPYSKTAVPLVVHS
jgi:hypothetical protein